MTIVNFEGQLETLEDNGTDCELDGMDVRRMGRRVVRLRGDLEGAFVPIELMSCDGELMSCGGGIEDPRIDWHITPLTDVPAPLPAMVQPSGQ